jgi:hypothetical protein
MSKKDDFEHKASATIENILKELKKTSSDAALNAKLNTLGNSFTRAFIDFSQTVACSLLVRAAAIICDITPDNIDVIISALKQPSRVFTMSDAPIDPYQHIMRYMARMRQTVCDRFNPQESNFGIIAELFCHVAVYYLMEARIWEYYSNDIWDSRDIIVIELAQFAWFFRGSEVNKRFEKLCLSTPEVLVGGIPDGANRVGCGDPPVYEAMKIGCIDEILKYGGRHKDRHSVAVATDPTERRFQQLIALQTLLSKIGSKFPKELKRQIRGGGSRRRTKILKTRYRANKYGKHKSISRRRR